MRDQYLKLYVDEKYFEIVRQNPCHEVIFYNQSDEQEIKRCDFIIFSDEMGNEIIRNMWEIKGKKVDYTTAWEGNSNDISLIVVITNLYESIMHLRHGIFAEKGAFDKDSPVKMVENETAIIKLCLQLLEGEIGVQNYINALEFQTSRLDHFYFESSAAILEQHSWLYKMTTKKNESIARIKQAVNEILDCLKDKRQWHQICRMAYKIHNEPAAILEYSLDI